MKNQFIHLNEQFGIVFGLLESSLRISFEIKLGPLLLSMGSLMITNILGPNFKDVDLNIIWFQQVGTCVKHALLREKL